MVRRTELVRLFEYEPDLLRHLGPKDAAAARDRSIVESLVLGRGELDPPGARADQVDLGFIVLEGLLLRRVDFFGRRSVELLGPGDVIRPYRPDESPATLPCQPSWKVCGPARIALLDRRFEREVARWPGVLSELLDRLAQRAAALSIQLAIAQMPRLDARLLCLFWRLADRWGTVGPDGVGLDLKLSQGTVAELVSARRSSVNSALRDLRDRELLLTPRPGRWVLKGDAPSEWRTSIAEAIIGADGTPAVSAA